jgi:hypothetical protein
MSSSWSSWVFVARNENIEKECEQGIKGAVLSIAEAETNQGWGLGWTDGNLVNGSCHLGTSVLKIC